MLPLALIVLPLISLALLPLLVERQISALQHEVLEVSDPARAQVRTIELSLAREQEATRAYLRTGDAGYARLHRTERARRTQAVATLAGLADRSDARVDALADALQAELVFSDATVDSLYSGALTRADFRGRIPAEQERVDSITATALEIGAAIARNGARRLAGVQTLERRAAVLSVVLAALALLAALMVLRLGVAYRALALSEGAARAESEAARAQAEQRRTELERLSESRARLVRGFTHDVKNPLGAAAGYLALMEEGLLEPEEGRRRVRRALDAALVLIDDMLQLARAEAGQLAVAREPVDLAHLAREVAEDSRAQAVAKGLLLVVATGDAPPPIESDAARIRQILGNLLGNAVKYTSSGRITVRVASRTGAVPGDAGSWAAVDVSDTGPGLSAAEVGLLFQEFRRLSSASGTAGNGLGLAISRRLARVLGGDVVVHSAPGDGSTFTLLLPLRFAAPAEHGQPPRESGHPQARPAPTTG